MVLSTFVGLYEDIIQLNFPIIRYISYCITLYYIIKEFKNLKIHSIIDSMFIFWTLVMIIMSFDKIISPNNNYLNLKKILSGELIVYFIPFIIFIRLDIEFIKVFFKVCFILSILGIFLVPIAAPIYQKIYGSETAYGYEHFSRIFTASGSIIVLGSYFFTKKKVILVITSILIALYFFLLTARRNMIVYFGLVIIISLYLFIINNKLSASVKITISVILSIILIILLILFYNYFDLFAETFLKFETGFESRDYIIDEFILDFNNNPSDWYIGRGFLGEFETTTLANDELTGLRDGIENGYLTHILRGGYIYIFFLAYYSLSAIYRGYILSKNKLTKSLSWIIIIYWIDMIGFGISNTHMKFVIIWIAISFCNDNLNLNKSDKDLKLILGKI